MEAKLIIQNLKCNGCTHTIITKLKVIDTIENVLVNIDDSVLQFNYKNDTALTEAKNKLFSLSYPIEGSTNSVVSKARSYVSCTVGKLSKD